MGTVVAVIASLALAQSAAAATFTVNTTADHVEDKFCDAPPGDCTLRDAVSLAGTNDTINVPKGTYMLNGSLGELSLVADHIVGVDGARDTFIQAEKSRVLLASSGASTVAGVTIRNGNGVGGVSNGAGGGVFVAAEATLIFSNSTISGNTGDDGRRHRRERAGSASSGRPCRATRRAPGASRAAAASPRPARSR